MREMVLPAQTNIETLSGKESSGGKHRLPKGSSDIVMITYLKEEEKVEATRHYCSCFKNSQIVLAI
jgi:hypothetical protein